MKKLKYILAVMLVFVMGGARVQKISAAPYKYHVTVMGGLHGLVNGQKQVDAYFNPNDPSDQFNPNNYSVTIHEADREKYEFIGFFVSGMDKFYDYEDVNAWAQAGPVTEDVVYVAAYGLKSDLVPYTVHYVNEDGTTIHPDVTYHGNPGTFTVIAYQYVEGYVPIDAYNRRVRLNPAGANEFTITYRRVTAPEGGSGGVIDGGTTIIYDDTVVYYDTGGGGNPGNPGGGNPAVTPVQPGGQEINDNPTPQTQPEQIITIDDPTAPQTQPEVIPEQTPGAHNQTSFWKQWGWVIGLGGLLLLLLLFLLLFRRKDEEEDA